MHTIYLHPFSAVTCPSTTSIVISELGNRYRKGTESGLAGSRPRFPLWHASQVSVKVLTWAAIFGHHIVSRNLASMILYDGCPAFGVS